MSEEEAVSLLENIRRVTDKEEIMSKYEACRYLNVSRSTFDSYVRSGELPRGVRKPGFKNILFLKKDLDLFIKKKREKHNKKDSSICFMTQNFYYFCYVNSKGECSACGEDRSSLAG